MARVIHHSRPGYIKQDDEVVVERSSTLAARVVNFIGGVIIALLALRFTLSLFGANRGNAFADFIYDTSRPFVEPFFGLFNYTPQFGVGRFEFETLVAIIVYAIVTALLVRLAMMTRRETY